MNTLSALTVTQFIQRYQTGSPFDLDNEKSCQAWRGNKLENYPESVADLIVEVSDPANLNRAEFNAIPTLVVKTNMAV